MGIHATTDKNNLANLQNRLGPKLAPFRGRGRWAKKQEVLAARQARVSALWWDNSADTDILLLWALPSRQLGSVRSADLKWTRNRVRRYAK